MITCAEKDLLHTSNLLTLMIRDIKLIKAIDLKFTMVSRKHHHSLIAGECFRFVCILLLNFNLYRIKSVRKILFANLENNWWVPTSLLTICYCGNHLSLYINTTVDWWGVKVKAQVQKNTDALSILWNTIDQMNTTIN